MIRDVCDSPVVPEEKRILVTAYASVMCGSKLASAGTLAMKSCHDTSLCLNWTCERKHM